MAISFNETELEITGYMPLRDSKLAMFNYPISKKEGYRRALMEKKPEWVPTGVEVKNFCPEIIPDNVARGFAIDAKGPRPDSEKGGKDMFGIEWVYVPVAGGSMEKPGEERLFDDANDWKNVIQWPDIDSWDWEGSAKENEEFLAGDQFNMVGLLNGFGFERLISFMGFEEAAVALVDEDQKAALKDLFDHTAELYCRIIDKFCQYYDIDGFSVHDDWGSQRAPFFSVEAGREILVPAMKKVTDCIHSHGKLAELHSCGCNELQIENYIAAGWDTWTPMGNINDTQMLYEKYGDRIIIGVKPDEYDLDNATEEEIRQAARDFADRFCSNPAKPCVINRAFAGWMNDTYTTELYKASRENYSK